VHFARTKAGKNLDFWKPFSDFYSFFGGRGYCRNLKKTDHKF